MADQYVISSLGNGQKHVLRNLLNVGLSYFNPAADKIFISRKAQISVPPFDLHAVYAGAYAAYGQYIRRINIH